MRRIKLREKIIRALRAQGFSLKNRSVSPKRMSKRSYKFVQQKACLAQIRKHKNFLSEEFEKVRIYFRNGSEISPSQIKLKLVEVKPNSLEERIYRWWNIAWWSVPYQNSYGRQMRFLLWDEFHNAPFGLIGLTSPTLKMAPRDKYLGIEYQGIQKDNLDYWINMSLNAQRIGALPPYNELLGGKMVALSLISKEIREAYSKKYKNAISIIEKRKLPANLLFITTTGAFGKSSIYNRLKYNGSFAAEFIGYTQGSGTFHINDELYGEIINYLKRCKIDVSREYGDGPSKRMKLLSTAFCKLRIANFHYHGIPRSIYLFSHVSNLKDVISSEKRPRWLSYGFEELSDFWKKRWCLPRSERNPSWRFFSAKKFEKEVSAKIGVKNG